jgi:hypothetical protein
LYLRPSPIKDTLEGGHEKAEKEDTSDKDDEIVLQIKGPGRVVSWAAAAGWMRKRRSGGLSGD